MTPTTRVLTTTMIAAAAISATSCSSMKRAASSVTDGAIAISQGAVDLVTRDDSYRYNTARFVIDLDGKEKTVDIALLPDAAPNHVSNFKTLVNEGYYEGIAVHRAIPGFIVQTGDPRSTQDKNKTIWGLGGPGYTIPAEINLKHKRGSVAMARLSDKVNPLRESSGSQFYITLKKHTPSLNGKYTVFGQVVSGIETIDSISRITTDENDVPARRVIIVSTSLIEGETPESNEVAAATTSPRPADKLPAEKVEEIAEENPDLAEENQATPTRKSFIKRLWGSLW